MESTKLMRWLWGEDPGGRIYLYEPQREVVGFTPPIAFTQRQDASFCRKGNASSPLLCGC